MPHFTVPTIPQDCDTLAEIDSLSALPRYGEIFKAAWQAWTSGTTAPVIGALGVLLVRGSIIAPHPDGHGRTCLIGAALCGRVYDNFNAYEEIMHYLPIEEDERSAITSGFDGRGLVNHRAAGEFAIRVRNLVIKIWGEIPRSSELLKKVAA